MGLLRFELKSITPEATRIPSYPTGPRNKTAIRKDVIRFTQILYLLSLNVMKKVREIIHNTTMSRIE